MTDTAIEVRGLAKRFGDHDALHDVDLEVARGHVLGYLGANGAGKTTTIRILLGLLRASAGTATIAGLDCWSARREVHRRVGYLPGDVAPALDRSARVHLGHLARLRGVDPRAAWPLAERFGLDLDRRIGTLSHGNRQKVGIVQAFMGAPEVLVLDEPTQGLDPLMQREFTTLVREVADAGAAVLLSSHILDEVDATADRVAVLRAGRVVLVDDVAALRDRARRHVELVLATAAPPDLLAGVPGVTDAEVTGTAVRLVVDGSMAEAFRRLAPFGIEAVTSGAEDLDDLFAAYGAAR